MKSASPQAGAATSGRGLRQRRRSRRAAFGLMALGGIILALGLPLAVALERLLQPATEQLPSSLSGMARSSARYGSEAVTEVTRLHRQRFLLTSGAVGIYGPRAEVTVWVTGTLSGLVARGMVDQMEESIAQGSSPFIPLGQLPLDGRPVYELSGMGRTHYYFQSGRRVVWISAEPAVASPALREALQFYP